MGSRRPSDRDRRAFVVRYAVDADIVFANEEDARRVTPCETLAELGELSMVCARRRGSE